MLWRFTYTCNKTKEQQWKRKEKRKKKKRETNKTKQNTWANMYMYMLSKIRIERQGKKGRTCVHVTKRSIHMHTEVWQQEHTTIKQSKQQHKWKWKEREKSRWLATRHDQHMEAVAVYWLHCVSAVYWLHCVSRQSRHSVILLTITFKVNIIAWNHNVVRCSEDHSAKHTYFSKRNETLYK